MVIGPIFLSHICDLSRRLLHSVFMALLGVFMTSNLKYRCQAITADVSFKTALAADFKREYKNIEFLWKQRPGVGGMIALPPVVSQIPGKYLCFLVTKATDRQHVNPQNLCWPELDSRISWLRE